MIGTARVYRSLSPQRLAMSRKRREQSVENANSCCPRLGGSDVAFGNGCGTRQTELGSLQTVSRMFEGEMIRMITVIRRQFPNGMEFSLLKCDKAFRILAETLKS